MKSQEVRGPGKVKIRRPFCVKEEMEYPSSNDVSLTELPSFIFFIYYKYHDIVLMFLWVV